MLSGSNATTGGPMLTLENLSAGMVVDGIADESKREMLQLADLLWQEHNHVSLRKVWEDLTKYPYMPRLHDEQVLLETVRQGARVTVSIQIEGETSDGFDDATRRTIQENAGVLGFEQASFEDQ